MAAIFGWLVLDESLPAVAILGIAVTLAGVAWVILQRPAARTATDHRRYARGVALALLAAACQAGGLLLSKQGMGEGWLPREHWLDPQAAALVRMTFAGVGMVPFVALHAWRERRAAQCGVVAARYGSRQAGLLLALAGAVFGPYLGMWFSLITTKLAPLAIAQTLFALPPVLILPFTWRLYHERIGWRAVLGALVALAGVALLFVLKQPPA
jgi:drug/metabolite transporter (DMT)-like permease